MRRRIRAKWNGTGAGMSRHIERGYVRHGGVVLGGFVTLARSHHCNAFAERAAASQ
jgi:hypothetical protein